MEITGTVEATLDGKVLSTSGEIGEGNTPEGLATKAIQILQDAHLIESQMLLSQFKHITSKTKQNKTNKDKTRHDNRHQRFTHQTLFFLTLYLITFFFLSSSSSTVTQYKENYVISLKEVDGNKIVVVTRVTM